MKKLAAISVLVLIAISFSVSVYAKGDCSGKSNKPIKKITQSDGTAPKSG